MFVFFKKNDSTVSLPATNITLIKQTQNVISIKYHTGNYYSENVSPNSSNSDIETFQIYYSNEEDALKKMKEFYWAASKNSGAFMF